jgi:hypothetical protein
LAYVGTFIVVQAVWVFIPLPGMMLRLVSSVLCPLLALAAAVATAPSQRSITAVTVCALGILASVMIWSRLQTTEEVVEIGLGIIASAWFCFQCCRLEGKHSAPPNPGQLPGEGAPAKKKRAA